MRIKQPLTLMILLLTTWMPPLSSVTTAQAQSTVLDEKQPASRTFHASPGAVSAQQLTTTTVTNSSTALTSTGAFTITTPPTLTEGTASGTLSGTGATTQTSGQSPTPATTAVKDPPLLGDTSTLAFAALGILVLAGALTTAFVIVRRRAGAGEVPASILVGKQVIPLNQPSLIVGRALLGSQDESVAEQHARLTLHNHRWVIELDQGQHMRVEGRLSRKNRLNDGAVVILGNMTSEARFTFRDTRLVPATLPSQEVR